MLTKARVAELVRLVYEARRDRLVHPEGKFDDAGRWYPSAREDCGGDGSSTRRPTRTWPYSYLLRCRTRQHARALVESALAGNDVPTDVLSAMRKVLPLRPDTADAIVRDYILDGCPAV